MTETVEWRWVDVGGDQHVVRFDELSDAFAKGALPPFVLVWRTGYAEWLAAANAPELASAIGPDRAAPHGLVARNPAILAPPSPPLSAYARVSPSILTLWSPGRWTAKAAVLPPRGRPPPPPRPPVAGIPPTHGFVSEPIPIRDVMPTLAGEEGGHSQTLRPAGALPPPPRAIPQAKIPVFEDALEVEVEDVEETGDDDELPPPPIPTPLPPPPIFLGSVAQPSPEPFPAFPAFPIDHEPRRTPIAENDAPPRARPPSDVRRARVASTGGLSRNTISTLTSVGLVLPGGLLLIAALLRSPRHAHPGANAVAPGASVEAKTAAFAVPARAPSSATPSRETAPSSATPPREAAGCSLERAPTRLSESVYAPVPLLIEETPDHSHGVLGFATTKSQATGLSIDPATLATTSVFSAPAGGAPMLGVVPLTRSDKLGFAVDRADPTFAYARTVDGASPFTLGVNGDGFSRRVGQSIDVIWPGKSKNPTITTPRVASVSGTGHAVVFRHGGQAGKVLVGWLADDGSKLTGLKAVGTEATLVGTPSIAAEDGAVLVAFAAKPAAEAPWHIELSRFAPGALPETAKEFAIPADGPGGEAISPSGDGFGAGRFVLQWTEGSAGSRAVRATLLSADLSPLGAPVDISTADQNAGQGVVWAHGDRVLVLYLVKTGSSDELWGASLKCH